ncbi:GNAT family N-acetyltransferase [Flavobacterium sp. NST-5]|uniref:GNAT family N-acetyltransferase n=1 Tax=Flavobacterium ichthyis TaxID=2698827 RepID=A0ABW9Z7H6_9FLAO|nr:GNAT family N-acetyltransferase [Flavobacterium ichthyis]NBL64810.1 GNAT family N-acetyltransferase [Flavobacterium ichthyis]
MISVKKYQPEYADGWNNFVENSKNGIFLFHRKYMEYHQHRFEDASLIFYKKNKVVAVFPANVMGNVVYSHQGLTFGGLILAKKITTPEVFEVYNLLKKQYQSLSFEKIIYKKIPTIFSEIASEEDLYAMFLDDAVLFRRDLSSVINLQNAINFSETKKQNVRKGKAKKLQVREIFEANLFWELLEKTLQKFDVKPVHTLQEIDYLRSSFPENIKFFGVYDSEKLLAGTVIYQFKNVVHTQYMASSVEGKKIGALDYLIFELLKKYADSEKYFSFGISTENNGRDLNEGLLLQKEMFGARALVLDHYEINLISKR